ncbi:MAG: hypothetical protein RIS53_163 [Bacillota bacterium]
MPKSNSLVAFSHMNALFDTYGKLLTTHQQSLMSDYYRFNLSLQEIADQKGISRAAVLDTLQKAKASLSHFEKILKLKSIKDQMTAISEDASIPTHLKKKILTILK